MSRRFAVNAPSVVSEVIDGEAVMMNLRLGYYYSATSVGAVAWQALEQGHAETTVAAALADAYVVPIEDASRELARFVDELLAHELVCETSASDGPTAPFVAAPGAVWSAPTLSIYTDMQDLLLLDPIHDVSATGWPMMKDEAT